VLPLRLISDPMRLIGLEATVLRCAARVLALSLCQRIEYRSRVLVRRMVGATYEEKRLPLELPIRRIISVVIAVLFVTGCSSSTGGSTTSTTSIASTTSTTAETTAGALVGKWERTGGDYSVLQGMIVEVDETIMAGTIIFVPRNQYEFKEGDVKWSEFTGVSQERVRIRDLVREADTGLPSYITGVISMTDDGGMLELTFPSSGTSQVWTRLP
jgi:hypothetical protein